MRPSSGLPPLAKVGEDAGFAADAAAAVGDEPGRSLSGHRLYCRLVLGRQQHTSWIRKEHRNGTASWDQM
jgi:hypothetical protein